MTETLLAVAASGGQKAVHEALQALDEMAQQSFEALLLALRALDDRLVFVVPLSHVENAMWC
jgi:hypothetical protein